MSSVLYIAPLFSNGSTQSIFYNYPTLRRNSWLTVLIAVGLLHLSCHKQGMEARYTWFFANHYRKSPVCGKDGWYFWETIWIKISNQWDWKHIIQNETDCASIVRRSSMLPGNSIILNIIEVLAGLNRPALDHNLLLWLFHDWSFMDLPHHWSSQNTRLLHLAVQLTLVNLS